MSGRRGKREVGRGVARREFLGTIAAGAAALGGLPLPPARLDRIGLQLYTVRDLLKQDFEGTLARVAEIGYLEVEFAGYDDHTPEQIAAALDRHYLSSPSAHVPFEAIAHKWEETLQAARRVGHQFVVCAWISEERRRTVDDWHAIADQLNRAGAACRDAGLQFAYHNHSYEFVSLGGRLPYDVLLERTDPALVHLELDLFWMTFGGGDPVAYFARYPGRFPLVHVKDMSPKPAPDVAPERVMADVGRGSIDWKRIFARSREAGIVHYFVEHDQPADPLASIRASFDYLKRLEF
jgi:sugar phosphate isomerase/epimerase